MTLNLYHYYEKTTGPFLNLSRLSEQEAQHISNQIRLAGNTFASRRSSDYTGIRRRLEAAARELFIAKGGEPRNSYPHYMTLGACDWIKSWYRNPGVVEIPCEEFLENTISFTYGDLFPTMRYEDEKPYRKQVYTLTEIMDLVRECGLPQEWNKNGDKGPERYIEAQVWDETVIKKWM